MKETRKRIVLLALIATLINGLAFGQGSNYAGHYVPSEPIVWTGKSNLTISGLEIVNPNGQSIRLVNCSNITIKNCKLGPSKGQGVYLYNCRNITITDCFMDEVATGVSAVESFGIKVINNDIRNVKGPFPLGQMVQFDEVNGAGNSISFNVVENINGQSYAEDAISMYKCNGIAGDPIKVVGNWIRGGGPSSSGGGIMTGDYGGSYILVENNILVNPGQYGLTIASGNNIVVQNNKVFSKKLPWSNVGVTRFKQYELPTFDNAIQYNEINYTSKYGSLNNTWDAGNMPVLTGWETNYYNPNLTESVLPEKIIGRAKAVTTETITAATESSKLKIFVTDRLTIEAAEALESGYIEVFNIKGQKVINQVLVGSNAEINTADWTAGIYVVKVSENGVQMEVKKVVIGR